MSSWLCDAGLGALGLPDCDPRVDAAWRRATLEDDPQQAQYEEWEAEETVDTSRLWLAFIGSPIRIATGKIDVPTYRNDIFDDLLESALNGSQYWIEKFKDNPQGSIRFDIRLIDGKHPHVKISFLNDSWEQEDSNVVPISYREIHDLLYEAHEFEFEWELEAFNKALKEEHLKRIPRFPSCLIKTKKPKPVEHPTIGLKLGGAEVVSYDKLEPLDELEF